MNQLLGCCTLVALVTLGIAHALADPIVNPPPLSARLKKWTRAMESAIKANLIAAMVVVGVPAAHATLIVFNDTTDTISETLDGDPVPSCTQVHEGATCGVQLTHFLVAPVMMNYLAEFEIVDPANSDDPKGTISDIGSFFVSVANPTDLFVFFFSDPIPSEPLSGPFYNANAPLEEKGILQTITLPPDLPQVAIDLTVKFASDVPEPATLPLLLSFLLALLGVGWFVRTSKAPQG